MSQNSNKIRWCINKAKRELEEKGMHRGLLEQEPNTGLAVKHIAKAEHNLDAALFFAENGYSDWPVSAFFYCIYHCFLAILRKYGYESGNQECTIAVIGMLKEEGKINMDDRLVNTLTLAKDDAHNTIKIREDFQYGTETEVNSQKLETLKDLCKEAIEEAKKIIYS